MSASGCKADTVVKRENVMVYFEPDTTREAQIGKVIGDAFAAFIILSVVILIASNVLR